MSGATASKSVARPFRCCCAPVVVTLFIAALGSGCSTGRFAMMNRRNDPLAGAPRLQNYKDPHLDDVIAHLNQNTERIQSWRADSVKIQTSGWSLSGKLAVEKGHRVRLIVSSPMGSEVDLGSNDERFWVWSRRMEPAFVTCKHENMEYARQKMGIPFEPQWLMQALSIAPLPVTNVKMESAPNQEQARLIQEVTSAHGYQLRRVVQVDVRKGIVLEHSLYDYNGIRIAQAKLSGHRHDKASGVVLPSRVLLDWPQHQMSMTMDLGKIQINPKTIPSQVWEMPEMPRYEVVHLDDGIDAPRIVTRPDPPVRFGAIEEFSTEEPDDQQSREPRGFDTTGRIRLSERPGQVIRTNSQDDDWDK